MNCKKELLEGVKRMKWVMMLLCLFSLPLCLTGCGEDDDEEVTSGAAALVGTWEQSGEDWYYRLTLNSNGTFTEIETEEGEADYSDSGTWSATDNQIFTHYPEDENESAYYRIVGNTLYLYESLDDYNNNRNAETLNRK